MDFWEFPTGKLSYNFHMSILEKFLPKPALVMQDTDHTLYFWAPNLVNATRSKARTFDTAEPLALEKKSKHVFEASLRTPASALFRCIS